MGTFSDFMSSKGITPAKLLRRSQRLEGLTNEDRALIRARAVKRRTNAGQSYADAGLAKPRSGRSLRPGHLNAAMQDKPVPGPVRTKFMRAAGSITGGTVDAKTLFGDVKGKQGKKPKK